MSATADPPLEADIKPCITKDEAVDLASEVYGLQVSIVKELNSYDDRNYHLIVESSSNPHVQPVSPYGYVLKIINSQDSNNLPFFEAQNEMLLLLREKGIPAPVPLKSVAGEYSSKQALPYQNKRRDHLLRLFEFQPGEILKNVPGSKRLYYQVGVWSARLDNALKSFYCSGFDTHTTMWHLKSAEKIKFYLGYVSDIQKREMVAEIINQFSNKIVLNMENLEKGIIHGDMNEQNILVTPSQDGSWDIASILDFGDVNYACYLFEIATAICYMMLEAVRNGLDPIECGGQTLEGYQFIRPLTELEHSLLKLAVCSRLCQSLVLGLYSQSLQPDNAYIGDTQTHGWSVLDQLWRVPDTRIATVWPLVN